MRVLVCIGERERVKGWLLGYCLGHFRTETIWLADSWQLFDPYWLSRQAPALARELLLKLRIARPFTIYQLRELLFGLTRLNLGNNPSIIVSGIDCFCDEVQGAELEGLERGIMKAMGWLSRRARLLLGAGSPSSRLLKQWWGEAIWEGLSCRSGQRWRHSWLSCAGFSRHWEGRTGRHFCAYTQMSRHTSPQSPIQTP